MTDKNRAGFTHHEKLRYEYLLSNLQYLNDREKEEFNYLYAKMKAFLSQHRRDQEVRRLEPVKQKVVERVTPVIEKPTSPTMPAPGGIPPYPVKEKRRVSKKPSSKPQSQVTSPLSQPTVTEPQKPKKTSRKPRRKYGKVKRILRVLALFLLASIVAMVVMFIKGMNDVTSNKETFNPAVTEFFDGQDSPNGTNILILGSDQRVTEQSENARADTIMVLNIGGNKGKMTLVSFMRDTLVNIPGASYGEGYYDHKLNAAFAIGEQDDHQGAELVRQVLKQNFDVDVKYYMMIDFQTFATAVDSLFPNGVEIDAEFATVDGEVVDAVDVPDDLNMQNGIVPDQTIHVGKQRMDGRTLLNYARFRKDDQADYGRTQRQQQVMGAIISQVKDPTKLFTGSEALGKIYALTSTNISYPFLLSEGLKSAATGKLKLERQTVPAFGDWYDDYDAYGGMGLLIDFEKYQKQLRDMGLR